MDNDINGSNGLRSGDLNISEIICKSESQLLVHFEKCTFMLK